MSSIPPAVAGSLERWKQALLDLTKRNRALNFRPNRVSTITVVDERPAEVFRTLVVEGAAMGFRAAVESVAGESPPAVREFAPYDRASVPDEHADAWLQTALAPADLGNSLRRIDDLARSSLDEQGVNTLFLSLGMLHYAEDDAGTQAFAAPLVLVPVRLVRAASGSAHEIIAADDDVTVNPTLAEYLRRRFAIELPSWVEPEGEAEPDILPLLTEVAARIRGRNGWRLTDEITLGLLGFAKLVMFRELETSAEAIARHPLIQQLVTRQGATPHGIGLPPDVTQARLDEVVPPESSAHLVPADGSQLRALLAVARGHSLVIEGPPGTGKSQTITNLVSQTLAAGKSVLFVAEKRAALDVVLARLHACGLGEFCLALHSPDAKRREVFEGMRAALDASAESAAGPSDATRRLPSVRAELSAYVAAIHGPRGSLQSSVFAALAQLAGLGDAPLLPWDGALPAIDRDGLELAHRCLVDLARAGEAIGDPRVHPWRDVERTSFPELVLQQIEVGARQLVSALSQTEQAATLAGASLGLPVAMGWEHVGAVAAAGELLRRSPGAPAEVLRDPSWDRMPPAASALVRALTELHQLREQCLRSVTIDALAIDHASDIAYVRSKRGFAGLFKFLDGRYRAIRTRWERLRVPGSAAGMAELADELDRVQSLAAATRALHAREAEGRALFGALWRGPDGDPAELVAYGEWVAAMRATAQRLALGERAVALAAAGRVDVTTLDAFVQQAREASSRAAELATTLHWSIDPAAQSFAGLRARLQAMLDGLTHAPSWGAFAAARQAARATIAAAITQRACAGEMPLASAPRIFLRAFWSRWLTDEIDRDPVLAGFQGLAHDHRVEEFRALDRQVLLDNRHRLVSELRARLQARLHAPELQRELAILLPEVRKQSRHKPLRRTLLAAGAAARAIHPCWLMSPLSVSQFTSADAPFDLVIFDEASQLRPEDAIATIARGRSLVVVGDPKQLPPTDFFATQLDPGADEDDDEHPDAASILEVAAGSGLPSTRLQWHYRSAHESLVAYSNARFYDAKLRTFPSAMRAHAGAGLVFEPIEGGIYEGSGRNRVEAERVVEAILAFAREQLRKPSDQRWSLGVGTFSLRQRLEIDELLYARLGAAPELAEFFDRDADEPFFVKNLESIQGDERDAIFLSMTYGPGPDGNVRHNFGPLNAEGGWKRLNVIITRARRLMRVFSSLRARDLDEGRAKIAGLLKGFLEYAETGRMSTGATALAPAELAAVARELADELGKRGIAVETQVGECGHRVDLAVVDPSRPDRFVIGIECDGPEYGAAETARDRDRLRDEVLRARGWHIVRMWSGEWFKARAGLLARVLAAIEAARGPAVREPVAEPPTPTPSPTPVVATASAPPSPIEYRVARGIAVPDGALIDAAVAEVVDALVSVVAIEGPIHEDELVARLAELWGHKRVGARIREHVLLACRTAQQATKIERRGPFVWMPGASVAPRVRGEDGPSEPDRIAPEEYDAAIRSVLHGRDGVPRERALAEIRSQLGFARTGKLLEARIGERMSALRERGELVEVTAGLRLRG